MCDLVLGLFASLLVVTHLNISQFWLLLLLPITSTTSVLLYFAVHDASQTQAVEVLITVEIRGYVTEKTHSGVNCEPIVTVQ